MRNGSRTETPRLVLVHDATTVSDAVAGKLHRMFEHANKMFDWNCIDAEMLGTNAGIWLLEVNRTPLVPSAL